MCRQLPAIFYMRMHMTHHTRFIGRKIDRGLIQSSYKYNSNYNSCYKEKSFTIVKFLFFGLVFLLETLDIVVFDKKY